MSGICEGRVVIVTGAGGGIGREHALAFAREGAHVVVNDIGASRQGDGRSPGPAQQVVADIEALGGKAVINADDVADWAGAERLVQTAIDAFGRLDVVVNNAGFLRDRMIVSLGEDEFDAVVRVHLKGHFAVMKHAGAYWRAQAKAGNTIDARLINTTSGAGLMGSVGQGNYAAAKAGITCLTQIAAVEMGRYGVTANAIAPAARTRMTEEAMPDMVRKPEDGSFDFYDPANISPLVVWLGSPESRDVTGRVFEVEGDKVSVATGWQHGPEAKAGRRWNPAELGPVVAKLIDEAPAPTPVYGA
ncbi:SDR family oxidoreductase [Streptomyces sp. SID3343]|uniref:SDR family oxidoreductase n=1 Tax=Streptomyces sp. SID3343 TaxID=2690260 RepID=UPI00136EC257|nr:SDR family oxidoreductase [Streptomyces sp. SID3343]MYV99458.1 SDR family NAD(P)-dependent oxidoreductase [Streptomyces sp. SID3343]